MAPTKTLAKLANHAAKLYPATGGVVDLTERQRQLRLMALVPVGEVWGVGRRLGAHLLDMNVRTALDLAQADPRIIRSRFSVVLERTVCELNGESCLELDEIRPPRQQILCSRSFGNKVIRQANMHEAICRYTARAAEKLREEKQAARQLSVFVRGESRHGMPGYSNCATGSLAVPSQDTRQFIRLAGQLLQGIWRDGYRYAKAGVILSDLQPFEHLQADLFADQQQTLRQQRLMQAMDTINDSGKGRVFLAGQGLRNAGWAMRQEFLSPAYTTRWKDLPVVR